MTADQDDIARCDRCTVAPVVALCDPHLRMVEHRHATYQGVTGRGVPFADFLATDVAAAVWRQGQRARMLARG